MSASSDPTGGGDLTPTPSADLVAALGGALPVLRDYVGLLAGAGIERGLLGPREVPRLWDRHVANCAALGELVPTGAAVTDVGSGAGLPGLVLALVRPDLRVALVDSTARRTRFLSEAVDALGVGDRVRVVTGRVEQAAVRDELGLADVVSSRAVAPLPRLVGWCLPLTAVGGTVLAIKGAQATAEVAAAGVALRRRDIGTVRVREVPFGGQTTSVVVVPRVSRETRRSR